MNAGRDHAAAAGVTEAVSERQRMLVISTPIGLPASSNST
jgi:hypothetical protein